MPKGRVVTPSSPMEKTIEFCIEKGLLPDKTLKDCLSCGALKSVMWISDVSKMYFPHRLRCRICRVSTSPKHNTWFRECRLYPWQVLNITYNFLAKTSRVTAAEEAEVTAATVLEWYNYCREVCYICINHDVKSIGGKGHTVEIEEINFKSRKGDDDVWIVGGIERETKDCFVVEVGDKEPDTLLSIINQWVLAGTSVVTNHWKVMQELVGKEDPSKVEKHFVDFMPGEDLSFTTSSAKTMMESLKTVIKKEGRLSDDERLLHMNEFVYRQKRVAQKLPTAAELFLPFLADIARVHPGYGKKGIGIMA